MAEQGAKWQHVCCVIEGAEESEWDIRASISACVCVCVCVQRTYEAKQMEEHM